MRDIVRDVHVPRLDAHHSYRAITVWVIRIQSMRSVTNKSIVCAGMYSRFVQFELFG